nr:SDR family NAD(P)-dependent oxidoreductase [Azospirillum picis]
MDGSVGTGGEQRLAAVTGGTGFLGRAVVAALVRNGWRVRLLARRDPGHPQLPTGGVEVVSGDLGADERLHRLVEGADAVVHAAGLIKARSREEFMRTNRDGSSRIARAVATTAPDARLVLVSSLAAREPQLSDYAASKRAGEEAATSACGRASWVVLRPSAIYGPWDRETFPIFRSARAWAMPLFHGPASRLCLIHVEDAAAAVVAMCAGGPSEAVFELSDERREGYPWRVVLEEAARAVGGSGRILPVPASVVTLAGALAGAVGPLVGRTPMLTSGKAREMLHADWSSSAAVQPPAGWWAPRIGLRDGFAATAKWYSDAAWM